MILMKFTPKFGVLYLVCFIVSICRSGRSATRGLGQLKTSARKCLPEVALLAYMPLHVYAHET